MPYTITDLAPSALKGGLIDGSESCTLSVRVQPRASRNRVGDYRDGTLRVSATAPPRDGRANAAVLELLAEALGVAKSRLRIIRGHAARDKVIAVDGLTATDVMQRLGIGAQSPGTHPHPNPLLQGRGDCGSEIRRCST